MKAMAMLCLFLSLAACTPNEKRLTPKFQVTLTLEDVTDLPACDESTEDLAAFISTTRIYMLCKVGQWQQNQQPQRS